MVPVDFLRIFNYFLAENFYSLPFSGLPSLTLSNLLEMGKNDLLLNSRVRLRNLSPFVFYPVRKISPNVARLCQSEYSIKDISQNLRKLVTVLTESFNHLIRNHLSMSNRNCLSRTTHCTSYLLFLWQKILLYRIILSTSVFDKCFRQVFLNTRLHKTSSKSLCSLFSLKGQGHVFSIMSSKRQIGRARVFHLQNHGRTTNENDFPDV